MPSRVLMATAMALAAASAHADVLLAESFTDISTLAGQGWVLTNQSVPVGTPSWFQGNPGVFGAQSGPADSYVAASYGGAAIGGMLNEWLVSPTFSTAVAGTISFWLRGAFDAGYTDSVAYGFSAGSSSATSSFTTLTTVTAPGAWTQYSLSFAAQGASSVGRFGIQYFGPADSSNYIGIDSVVVNSNAVTAPIPEPSTWALMAVGLIGAGVARRRRIAVRR